MSWSSLVSGRTVTCGPSESESDRFGRSVGRIEVPLEAPREEASALVRRELARPTPDLLFLRYPAQYVDWFAAFRGHGRDLLFADTLVYWRLDLDDARIGPGESRSGLAIERSPMPEDDLAALVSDVFEDYANHYRANPLLSPRSALMGYREWVRRSVERDALVRLVHSDQGTVGFATLTIGECGVAEVLLAGIRTDVQGTGLYPHLLAGCADLARARRCRQLVISTQGHNTDVQRAWSRFGMVPVATFSTVHALRVGLLPTRP